MLHTTLVACGVAALVLASPKLFTAVKALGACYLLYLAWAGIRTAPQRSGPQSPVLTMAQLYRRGIVMNITNPKVSVLFLAFLPQFTRPEHGSLAGQILWLGMLFILATIFIFGGIALPAGKLGARLRQSTRMRRWLNWLASTIFTALALHPLLSHAEG